MSTFHTTATAEHHEVPPVMAPGGGGTLQNFFENADAAAGLGTVYTIGGNDTFNGGFGPSGDVDWVRVQLTAGQTYTFNLSSSQTDTYLILRDGNGTVIAFDDDTVGTNSQIVYTPTAGGAFYLQADQFLNIAGGVGPVASYSLSSSVALPPAIWTPAEMANQLINGYWAFAQQEARHFDIRVGTEITVNLNGLTGTMTSLARQAMQTWTDTTGLRFRETTGTAQIQFLSDAGSAGPDAFANSVTNNGIIESSTVTIDQEWLDSQGNSLFTYTFQTYIHEIGHALGLGHAGNYNGSATFGTDNVALNESWQISVMSYFDQAENTQIADTYAYVFTPMIADILAIGQLYGVATTLRTGNTTYGNNSNAGGNYDRFAPTNTDSDEDITITVTVVDNGGSDTFDFRQGTSNQRIDLRAGTVSDVYGDLGTIGIALGTVIENAVGGRGNDTVTGNEAGNRIDGNDGSDNLAGNGGRDSLFGGRGFDTLNGGEGDDVLLGGTTADDVRDVLFGGNGADNMDGGAGNDELNGGFGNDTLLGSLGADTMVGNGNNDLLSGGGSADLMSGNEGVDFLNGGFGFDRLNGGAGADRFFHQGVADHGSDWLQDYSAAEGDLLLVGLASATFGQFQVNFATTAGAGNAGVTEAFVVYRPTGQILFALVDGGADAQINLQIGTQVFDLLS